MKGDMVNAVGFHRTDLLRLGKTISGARIHQTASLPDDIMAQVQRCVIEGLGLRS
jgi:mRNA interferase MazF